MGIITRMRKQTCVYWAPTGNRDRNNNPILAAPVQMTCRWTDVNELFIDASGKQSVSNAKIFTELDVQVEGYLKLGLLTDLVDSSSNNPFTNSGTFRIRKFTKLPNLRNTEYLRTVMV